MSGFGRGRGAGEAAVVAPGSPCFALGFVPCFVPGFVFGFEAAVVVLARAVPVVFTGVVDRVSAEVVVAGVPRCDVVGATVFAVLVAVVVEVVVVVFAVAATDRATEVTGFVTTLAAGSVTVATGFAVDRFDPWVVFATLCGRVLPGFSAVFVTWVAVPATV